MMGPNITSLPSRLLAMLILATSLLSSGCNKGEAERLSCQTDLDCSNQNLSSALKCLPVTAGETLNDFCRKDSRFCPFHRHAPTMYAMPRICDVDDNGDGLADVYLVDQYAPVFHANGSLNAGELGISGLFQASCGSAPGMTIAAWICPSRAFASHRARSSNSPGPTLLSDTLRKHRAPLNPVNRLCVDVKSSTCVRDDDCLMGNCIANACSNGSSPVAATTELQ